MTEKNFKEKIDGIKQESDRLTREVRQRLLTYIVAAFGLVAGLAWNDAIRSLIDHLFPLSKNSLFAKFIYAISVTLAVVLVTVYLVKILKKEGE
jgi:hypothetical protein